MRLPPAGFFVRQTPIRFKETQIPTNLKRNNTAFDNHKKREKNDKRIYKNKTLDECNKRKHLKKKQVYLRVT